MTTNQSPTTTSAPRPLTLAEFKMWLLGVEEMQDDGWVPSPDQWKRIRNRIDAIEEPIAQPMVYHATDTIPPYPIARGDVPQHPQPAQLDQVYGHPSAILGVSPTNQPTSPLFATGVNNALTKTPNIDTTNGNYQSGFA